jgi:hypothetical protein
MLNIGNPGQFMAELKSIQIYFELLYSAHIEGFHKRIDMNDVNVVFNTLNSVYQAIIILMHLVTQLVKFKHQNSGGFFDFQISFESRLDNFLNSFREEACSFHDVDQQLVHEVMNGIDHLKGNFLFFSNSIFKGFEDLKMEVNDRRDHEGIRMEIQLVEAAIWNMNELMIEHSDRLGRVGSDTLRLEVVLRTMISDFDTKLTNEMAGRLGEINLELNARFQATDQRLAKIVVFLNEQNIVQRKMITR